MSMQTSIAAGKQYLLDTYAQVPVVFDRGEGMYLFDEEGNKYLDFVGGIAVNALGYHDAGLSAAIAEVVEKGLLHCSNLYYNTPFKTRAAPLRRPGFFCNSGAEATKPPSVARKFGHKSSPARTDYLWSTFHGAPKVHHSDRQVGIMELDPLPRIQLCRVQQFGECEGLGQ